LEHFDKKEAEHNNILNNSNLNTEDPDNDMLQEVPNRVMQVPASNTPQEIQQKIEETQQQQQQRDEEKRYQTHFQLQMNPLSANNYTPAAAGPQQILVQPPQHQYQPQPIPSAPAPEIGENIQFQQQIHQPFTRTPILDSDYEFVSILKLA
jgi:hypothetical protein